MTKVGREVRKFLAYNFGVSMRSSSMEKDDFLHWVIPNFRARYPDYPINADDALVAYMRYEIDATDKSLKRFSRKTIGRL